MSVCGEERPVKNEKLLMCEGLRTVHDFFLFL